MYLALGFVLIDGAVFPFQLKLDYCIKADKSYGQNENIGNDIFEKVELRNFMACLLMQIDVTLCAANIIPKEK